MTPCQKTKLKDGAFSRSMPLLNLRASIDGEENYIVEGYAAKYESYELYRDGEDYVVMEQFTRDNFEGADKSDVIMQFDHTGWVFARTSNGTLELIVDEIGLKIVANLGKTEGARRLYEDIKAGMITKMSWRFAVDSDDCIITRVEAGAKTTYMLTYKKIRKIYDVSAVSIPANNETEISARSVVDGVIAAENARRDAESALNNRIIALLNWAERKI